MLWRPQARYGAEHRFAFEADKVKYRSGSRGGTGDNDLGLPADCCHTQRNGNSFTTSLKAVDVDSHHDNITPKSKLNLERT